MSYILFFVVLLYSVPFLNVRLLVCKIFTPVRGLNSQLGAKLSKLAKAMCLPLPPNLPPWVAGLVIENEQGAAQDVEDDGGEADDKKELCVIADLTFVKAGIGKVVRYQTSTSVLHLSCSCCRGEEQADIGKDEQPEDLLGLVHLVTQFTG